VAPMTAINVWFLHLEEALRERVAPAIRQLRTRYSRVILPTFLALFLIGVYVSLRVSNVALADLLFVPLIGVFLGALATTVSNAWGLQLIASYSAVRLSFRDAVLVSSFGSLSNILPIPGSILVRGGALVSRGATVKQSATGIALAAVIWIGLAGLVTGLALATQGAALGWPAVLLCGLLSIAALGRLALQGNARLAAAFLVQRAVMLSITVLRFWFGFQAVGASANLVEAATFSVASVFGAVVAIVPAGLAVSEAMAAALAGLTALSPAIVFIVVALNRVVGLLGNGAVFFVVNLCSITNETGSDK